MPEKKNYADGTFCWADLASKNLGQAIEFYGSLFGWQTRESPASSESSMSYAMCTLDGKFVCGIGELSEEMQANGVPPVWSTYISTSDLDATIAKGVELGAEVQVPAMKVEEFGHMAFLKSPTGEVFGLWQPGIHCGAQLINEPGAVCWNELNTKDAAKSRPFYEGLCGFTSKIQDMGGIDYTMLMKGEEMEGGLMEMTEEWGDAPSHWMVYFTVENCDESAEKVKALGGKVCVPPTDISVGRFAVVEDHDGAVFSIIQNKG